MSRVPDAAQVRAAVEVVAPWLDDDNDDDTRPGATASTGPGDGQTSKPGRSAIAAAVRGTVGLLAQELPGHAVELRVPPFAATQCVEGPRHTRGTPPNVVETDPRTWLLLATGRVSWEAAVDSGRVRASGTRASEVAAGLPVVRVP